MRLTSRDLFLLGMVVVFWGLHPPIMRMGVLTIEPISLNFVRFLLTGLLFLPFAGRISKQDLILLIPVSLFFCCMNLMFAHLALAQINGNSFVVLIQVAQPMTLILAWIFFKEKFGLYTTAGIAVSFAGLMVTFGAPDITQHPTGAIFTLLAALGWSLGSIAMKKTGHIPSGTFLAYAYLMAAPISLLGTLLLEDNQVERFLEADPYKLGFVIFYQVVMMGLMSVAWGRLMSRNTAQLITPFLMIQPIFAVVGGYFLLGEKLNMNVLLGGLVVLLGIGIINWRAIIKRRPQVEPQITD